MLFLFQTQSPSNPGLGAESEFVGRFLFHLCVPHLWSKIVHKDTPGRQKSSQKSYWATDAASQCPGAQIYSKNEASEGGTVSCGPDKKPIFGT